MAPEGPATGPSAPQQQQQQGQQQEEKRKEKKTCLVTVGTTYFDELIRAVDCERVAAALKRRGFTDLVLQTGTGQYEPSVLVPRGTISRQQLAGGLAVSCFRLAPSLGAHLAAADLVLTHAGSGSVFEGLAAGKTLVVVPNARLMANHQQELAEELEALGHVVAATPETLVEVLETADFSRLKPYERGSAEGIVAAIDRLMGRPPSVQLRSHAGS